MMVKPICSTTVANPVSIGCLLVLIANVGIPQTNRIDVGATQTPSSVWY